MGIPLPALQVRSPGIAASYGEGQQEGLGLRGLRQTMQGRDNQLAEEKRIQAERAKLQEAILQAKDVEMGIDLYEKRGGDPQFVQKIREGRIKERKDLREEDEAKAKTRAERNKAYAGAIAALKQLPPEQRPQAYSAIIQQMGIQGAPPEYPGDQMLDVFGLAVIDSEKQRQLAETERHNKGMEAAQAATLNAPTTTEKDFQTWYKSQLAASGQQPNARIEMEARNEYRAKERVSQLLTPEEEAQKIRLAQETRDPDAGTRGQFVTLTDEQGRVIGAWNPKTQKVEQVPAEFRGARKGGLSEGALSQRATLAELQQQSHMLKGLAERNKWSIGPMDAMFGALASWTTGNKPEVAEMRRLAGNLSDMLLRARSGAQINEQEYARLSKLVPQMSDPESNFFTKLESFQGELTRTLQRRSGDTAVANPSVSSGPVDLNATASGSRPRRRNPQTGEEVEWNGQAWVEVPKK